MEREYPIACHLLGASGAASRIGLERSCHGRPAGFWTPTRRARVACGLLSEARLPQEGEKRNCSWLSRSGYGEG